MDRRNELKWTGIDWGHGPCKSLQTIWQWVPEQDGWLKLVKVATEEEVKMFTTHSCRFSFGEKVILDGDPEIKFIVTGITIRQGSQQIEVSWVHNGDVKSTWVEEFRLITAERLDE